MPLRLRSLLTGLMLSWLCGLAVLASAGCSFEDRAAYSQDGQAPPQSPNTPSSASPSSATDVPKDRPKNRLARESSPYLLLHVHNPVDWYAWGPEAFEAAKQQNKPIFLSVGYSSCYWCHVMERLVFENEEIAAYMNAHFISIKVDREERPDVDDIYMTSLQVYLQAIGSDQGGGWPLSMFLTPDGKPFAGGTYYPPDDLPGRPGFPHVLRTIQNLWTTRQKDIEGSADIIANEVRRVMKPPVIQQKVPLTRKLVDQSIAAVLEQYDAEHGGLDFNPDQPDSSKFPVPSRLMLLQAQAGRPGSAQALKALDHTLQAMAAGGIYDHLGGGFHRYSTDRRWLVPHFEKMLYDNAQLGEVYSRAFERTRRQPYRATAEGTFQFVLREMTHPDGGFHSALDAETEGIEGAYYVWSREEVTKILGEEDSRIFQAAYGLDRPEFFEHGYVLHHPRSPADSAEQVELSEKELLSRLAGMREKLLSARQKRKPLLDDDKVLTSWNGQMIHALAFGGKSLNRTDYVAAAEKGAVFLASRLRDEKGHLLRTWRNGEAKLNAYLEDYANLIAAMLALHEVTGEEKWLHAARRLMDDQIELFWDAEGKGFFYTSHGHESLIARAKDSYDSVLPSGNSVSVRNLVRLAAITTDHRYRDYARETLHLFAPALDRSPGNMPYMALALQEYLDAFGEESATPAAPAAVAVPAPMPPSTPATPMSPAPPQKPVPLTASQADPSGQHKARATVYLGARQLVAGTSVPVAVVLDIDAGWHLNANPPRPKMVIPVDVSMTSPSTVEWTGVTYPAGKDFAVKGFDEPVSVYENQTVIHGSLTVPESLAGQTAAVTFSIRYQACNDSNCTRPMTISLPVQMPIAAAGTRLEPANGSLFSVK